MRESAAKWDLHPTYGFIPADTVILLTEDVTELRQTEKQLRLTQRLEAVGRLAAGVAHDFNNLLSVIISHAGFAIEELRDNDPVRADVIEIQKAGERAAALTRQLLAFSRRQVLEPKLVDVNKVITGIESMLRRLSGEDMAIETHLAQDLGSVLTDPGQLEQVLVNLAVNARDAMPRGGKTAGVELDRDYAERRLASCRWSTDRFERRIISIGYTRGFPTMTLELRRRRPSWTRGLSKKPRGLLST